MDTTQPFAAVLDAATGRVSPEGPLQERRLSDLEGLYADAGAWRAAVDGGRPARLHGQRGAGARARGRGPVLDHHDPAGRRRRRAVHDQGPLAHRAGGRGVRGHRRRGRPAAVRRHGAPLARAHGRRGRLHPAGLGASHGEHGPPGVLVPGDLPGRRRPRLRAGAAPRHGRARGARRGRLRGARRHEAASDQVLARPRGDDLPDRRRARRGRRPRVDRLQRRRRERRARRGRRQAGRRDHQGVGLLVLADDAGRRQEGGRRLRREGQPVRPDLGDRRQRAGAADGELDLARRRRRSRSPRTPPTRSTTSSTARATAASR